MREVFTILAPDFFKSDFNCSLTYGVVFNQLLFSKCLKKPELGADSLTKNKITFLAKI